MSVSPLYTTIESVKVRLGNKVQFQTGSSAQDGEISNDFLTQLILDAETAVEQELRSRYSIPFRSKTSGTFAGLPDHTKRALRRVIDMKAVIDILEYDFGRGGVIDSENYHKNISENFVTSIKKLLGRDQIGENEKIDRYKFSPPLEDLVLAEGNKYADDGFRGTIINTDASVNDAVSFAHNAINDPSKAYPRTRGPGGL